LLVRLSSMYLSHFVVRTSDTIGDSELMKFVMFETPPRKETEDKPSHSSNDTEVPYFICLHDLRLCLL
jgi:hypothetical protein